MLAFYLPIPADGSNEEADPWPLLEVCPEPLSTDDPGVRSAATFIRSGRRVRCDPFVLRGRLDGFVQQAPRGVASVACPSCLVGATSLEQASLRGSGTGDSSAAAAQDVGEADRKHGTE